MAESPLWAAISALKGGMSARAGLQAYRGAGGSVRDATWYRLFSEARSSLASQSEEMGRPLNRRPLASETLAFTTPKARGFLQQIDVYVRVRETGAVEVRPFSLRTDALMTRADAIETGVDAFSAHADRYGEQILGAAYTGTYILVEEST